MKSNRQETGSSFEESMLKLVCSLPKVLKFLPRDKAADARIFMISFQYWLGRSPENLELLMLIVGQDYVPPIKEFLVGKEKVIAEDSILLPNKEI